MKLLIELTSFNVIPLLQLMQWSVLGVEANQAQFTLLTLFKCDNIPMCATSQPSKSFKVVSKAQCVLYCQRQRQQPESCVGVNYRDQNNTCDAFFNAVTVFAKDVPGCQYIQKGSDNNLKSYCNPATCVQTGSFSLSAPTGKISSPNYPNLYVNNADCSWIITPQAPYTGVTLTFKDGFSTQNNYDFVYIFNLAGGSLGSRTSYGNPPPVTTTGGMRVVFKSDASVTDYGFEATYTMIII